MRKRRQEWRELLEWFVAENRAILAARDGNGRWRPVEFFRPEKIAKSTRKLSELVGLIARSWWWEIPVGSAEFSRLRESALEVLVGLRCLLDDEYGIVRWMEFWERVFFRMMAWNRPLMVILAKVEVRTRLMQRHLESPLVYIGLALAAMEELPRVCVASMEEPVVAEIAKGVLRLGQGVQRPQRGRRHLRSDPKGQCGVHRRIDRTREGIGRGAHSEVETRIGRAHFGIWSRKTLSKSSVAKKFKIFINGGFRLEIVALFSLGLGGEGTD